MRTYQSPEMEIVFFEVEDIISTSGKKTVCVEPEYQKRYQAKYLLTKAEWHEYKKLQRLAEENGLQICPKVRLLDIIEPRKGEEDYKALLNKVQSKHIDFLICDKDLHIKAVLELDDGSHDRKDRQNRDEFVDLILTSVGYKVIRTRSVTDTTLDCLKEPEVAPTQAPEE